jgi:hypothetical protein
MGQFEVRPGAGDGILGRAASRAAGNVETGML